MAKRKIVTLEDAILREKSREVTEFDAKLGQLLDDMTETMTAASGVGLAAPQVGVLKRVIVVSTNGKVFYEMVNPVIVKSKGVQVGLEGCLSVPGRHGNVSRPKKITVIGQDRNGEKITVRAENFLAVAFCHEIDHLYGVLYIDKLEKENTPDIKEVGQ